MAEYLSLSVITPERILLHVDRATKVRLRLADQGWLSIYRNHAPMLAEMAPGYVQYETDVETGEIHVEAGIVAVSDNAVEVLTSGLVAREVEPEQDDESLKFDRLARELLSALAGSSEGTEA